MKIADITTLTDLANRYGPFFFSILFLCGLLLTFNRAVGKGHAEPRATLYRRLLVATYAIGTVLVVVSVVAWTMRPTLHVFRGTIRGVPSYVQFDSDDAFFRDELKLIMGSEQPLKNVHFVAISVVPFREGGKIGLEFSKGGEQRMALDVPFRVEDDPAFTWSWDEKAQRQILLPIGQTQRHVSLPFVRTAYASEAPAIARESVTSTAPPDQVRGVPTSAPRPVGPAGPTLNQEAQALVASIQAPTESVGGKIIALAALSKFDDVGLSILMRARTLREPVAVTLLDLSRHSDPELAARARTVLARCDLVALLIGEARAEPKQPGSLRLVQDILERMDPPQAQRVVEATSQQTKLPRFERAAPEVKGREAAQPIATGTRLGDRYYVRATWNPKDKATLKCLAGLFNRELYNTGTPAQEEATMWTRNGRRLVYAGGAWGKDWAISISIEIRQCGGHATFVRYE